MARLLLLLLPCLLLFQCKRDEADPQPTTHELMTIDQVRALNGTQMPASVYITDASKTGVFRLDGGDSRSADNTGTVLVTANGKRYKRVYTGDASAAWFDITTEDDDIGPELQVAVDAVNALHIPDGSYTQRTTVFLKSNLTLRGNAGRVLITLPDHPVSLGNDPSNKDLSNILIEGLSWRYTTDKVGLDISRIHIDGPSVSNLTIQNCNSTDLASKAHTNWFTLKIQARKTASNITVRNNSVQAWRMGIEIFNHDNHNVYAGKNIVVNDNYVYGCEFGISLSGPLENLIVDNNHVKDCSLFGIEIAGAARNVKIRNNRFEGTFDKFLEGSNDGNGNGTVTGGMEISDNSTVGTCGGGIQLFNGGTVKFTNNIFKMTGMIELAHSTKGGTFSGNLIESAADKAIVCDNSPGNQFIRNIISNKNSSRNHATLLAYGSKAINNVLSNNTIIKGAGGTYYEAMQGGSFTATSNYDEAGKIIQ